MKKKLFIAVCGLLVVVAAQAQPLLKTHVETGDVEGVLDGTDLVVYKAIPFAAIRRYLLQLRQWVNSDGRLHSRLSRGKGC